MSSAPDGPASKRLKLSSESSELDNSQFDEETQKALEEIDKEQLEIDSLNEKVTEEILKVEQRYNKLKQPHYDQRSTLIQRVPKFWANAFCNHPQISVILEEEEEECLQSLTKVEVEEFDDIQSGYKIKLHFDDNPFFSNKELIKEFYLTATGETASRSSPIKWKEGMNLAERKKSDGDTNSFFQWFTDNSDPMSDEIAEVIKDDMWRNPLQYFLALDDNDSDEEGLDDTANTTGEGDGEEEDGEEEDEGE